MALQVWLPLNKGLNNQGLKGDITATSTAVLSSTGSPIGGCYTFTASQNITITGVDFSKLTNASISVWVKQTSLVNTVFFTGPSTSHYVVAANTNGTSNIYHSGNVGGTKKVYVDGVEGTKLGAAGQWHHYVVTGINLSAWTGNVIKFNNYSSSYNFAGSVCDIRIYDHELSAKEVNEISKGLVQHFKLNYLSINSQNSIIIEPDGSKWAHVVHHNNPGGGVFAQTDDFVGGVYKDVNRWFKFYEVVTKLSSFEFMVKQKTTSSATEVKYRWIQNVSPIGATYEQVAPAQVTRITTNGYTNGNFGGLYVTNSNAHLCIANATKGNWYGAFGSWTAYQNGTPGYPNTVVTTGYMDLYVRVYDDIVIVDCSGYRNDGTVYGMPTLDYSSPRYDACIVTSTNNCINAGRGGMIADAFSVSIWGHMSSWGSYSARLASCTEGGGWNFEPYESKMSFISYAGAYARALDNTALSSLSSGWHHFVGVFDGYAKKVYMYRDGVMVGSATTTNATTTYYSNNVVFIGAEAAANQTTPNGYYFPGKLSDFRIYGTALSAEDIAELYHTGASVDNKGNFFCGEIKEE